MVAFARPARRLMMMVCGSTGPFDEFNPFFVGRQRLGLELLYALNKRPMSAEQACSALKISRKEGGRLLDDWARINALREESGVYYVNFPIFMKEDLMILARATEPVARGLADQISSHPEKICSLAKDFSAAQQVQTEKLLFAALGCFVLDWLGLETLEEDGFLVKNKPQPGNRDYLLKAREEVDRKTAVRLYDRMYWGSHTDTSDGYTFTSFGDHHGVRYAFPDALWSLQTSPKAAQKSSNLPAWITQKLSTIAQSLSKKMLQDTAGLLFRINAEQTISTKELAENSAESWSRDLVCLLEDMNYIVREKGMLKLNYPVFTDNDKKIVEQIADIALPLVKKTTRQNYSMLKTALKNTTPLKNKIALNEVLNEAWHWIFAQTNKILAEKGFVYNPPTKRLTEARYIAWIAEFSADAFSFP